MLRSIAPGFHRVKALYIADLRQERLETVLVYVLMHTVFYYLFVDDIHYS